MTNEELQAIRERTDAATPGPWLVRVYGLLPAQDIQIVFPSSQKQRLQGLSDDEIEAEISANAIFVSFARTDIPALLAEVARLQAEVYRLDSWDGMMATLDAHYPAAVFDGSSGDDGPRMIVMLRTIDGLRAALERAEEYMSDSGVTAFRRSLT